MGLDLYIVYGVTITGHRVRLYILGAERFLISCQSDRLVYWKSLFKLAS
jgi:hypothetical protein